MPTLAEKLAGWEKVSNVYYLAGNDPPVVPVAAACGVVFAAFMGVRLAGRSHFSRHRQQSFVAKTGGAV